MNRQDASATPFELLSRLERDSRASGFQLPQPLEVRSQWRGITFAVDRWRLVAHLDMINDVVECGSITPVPRTKGWMRGVVNVRGTLYSITDLAALLGCPPMVVESEGMLLVLNKKELQSALLVSRVYGLKSFDLDRDVGEAAIFSDEIKPFIERAFVADGQTWGVLTINQLVESDVFREIELKATA